MCVRMHVDSAIVAERLKERMTSRGLLCVLLKGGCRYEGGRILEVKEKDGGVLFRLAVSSNCKWSWES